jgi:hypothetical protein
VPVGSSCRCVAPLLTTQELRIVQICRKSPYERELPDASIGKGPEGGSDTAGYTRVPHTERGTVEMKQCSCGRRVAVCGSHVDRNLRILPSKTSAYHFTPAHTNIEHGGNAKAEAKNARCVRSGPPKASELLIRAVFREILWFFAKHISICREPSTPRSQHGADTRNQYSGTPRGSMRNPTPAPNDNTRHVFIGDISPVRRLDTSQIHAA